MKLSIGSVGPGFLLFLVFLILKLCKVIGWSWWFITMPLYAVPAVVIGLALAGLLVAGIVTLVIFLVALLTSRKAKRMSPVPPQDARR